ncbi:hypothetical protein [Streptomyces sp. NPDC090056]
MERAYLNNRSGEHRIHIEIDEAEIAAAGRTLYAAHRPLLQRTLDHLNR